MAALTRHFHLSPPATSIAVVLALTLGLVVPESGLAGPPSSVDLFESESGASVFSGALIEVIADPRHPLRDRAVHAASALGRDASDAAPLLIAAICDHDESIHLSACSAVRQMRPLTPRDLAALVDLLDNDDLQVRVRAACVLEWMGQDALVAVPRLLREWSQLAPVGDASAELSWTFAEAIARIDPECEEIVPALLDVFRDSRLSVIRRGVAAGLLATTKAGDDQEIYKALEAVVQLDEGPIIEETPEFAEHGRSDRTYLRLAAALALWKRNPDPRIVRWLVRSVAIEANTKAARCAIMEAIAELGPQGEPGLPYLIEIVESTRHLPPHETCRRTAIEAIGGVGIAAGSAVPTLANEVADRKSSYDSRLVILALGKIGPSAVHALPVLEAELAHQDPEIRVLAADAIRRIGGNTSATIPVLIAGLQVMDVFGPGVGNHFRARQAAEIRISSATGLAELGNGATKAIPALIRVARNDRFPTVREAAQKAALRIAARSKQSSRE